MLNAIRQRMPTISNKLSMRLSVQELSAIQQEQVVAGKQLIDAKANVIFITLSGAAVLFSLLALSLLLSAVSNFAMSIKSLADVMFNTINLTLPLVSAAAIIYITPKMLYMKHLQREERLLLANQASIDLTDPIESIAELTKSPSPQITTKKLSFRESTDDNDWELTLVNTPEPNEDGIAVKSILKPKNSP